MTLSLFLSLCALYDLYNMVSVCVTLCVQAALFGTYPSTFGMLLCSVVTGRPPPLCSARLCRPEPCSEV